jgi:hypothetical protein
MKNKSIFDLDYKLLFALIIFSYFIISFSSNNLVFTKEFYFDILNGILSENRIESFIETKMKYEWIGYFFIPVFLLLKLFVVSCLIYIGLNISDYSTNFKSLFCIVTIAESTMVIASLFKLYYIVIFNINDIEVLKRFFPLSIITFFNLKNIPFYLVYPLQQINIFELGYWLLLAYGIKTLENVDFKKALKITSLSYGVGLVIWSIFIIFIQLQFS